MQRAAPKMLGNFGAAFQISGNFSNFVWAKLTLSWQQKFVCLRESIFQIQKYNAER